MSAKFENGEKNISDSQTMFRVEFLSSVCERSFESLDSITSSLFGFLIHPPLPVWSGAIAGG